MNDRITEPRIETVEFPEHDIEITLMLTQHEHAVSLAFTNETPPSAVAHALRAQARVFDELAAKWGDDE